MYKKIVKNLVDGSLIVKLYIFSRSGFIFKQSLGNNQFCETLRIYLICEVRGHRKRILLDKICLKQIVYWDYASGGEFCFNNNRYLD